MGSTLFSSALFTKAPKGAFFYCPYELRIIKRGKMVFLSLDGKPRPLAGQGGLAPPQAGEAQENYFTELLIM